MDEATVELRKGDNGPTEKEIAACKPCRMAAVVLFVVCLIAMLIAAIIIIATAPKCATPLSDNLHQDIQHGITYSVDVKNYLDENGDGFGDLKGLISKLDYIKSLGVKTLSVDGVLNISNHKSVSNDIGSMDDLENLITQAKDKEINVLLSFSPVYTGLEHPLFLKSSQNVTLYSGLYVWTAVSNQPYWLDINGQSAWFPSNSYNYYYGYYGQQYPSLNYESSEVQDYMIEVLSFWLEKGIAGFQLDGLSRLMTDVEIKENTNSKSYTQDLPSVHYLLRKWNTLLKEKSAVMVGNPQGNAVNSSCYYGTAKNPELDVNINSAFVSKLANAFNASLLSEELKGVKEFSSPAWSTKSSSGQRLADVVTAANALAYGVMLASLPGMLSLSYGDEIGIFNSPGIGAIEPIMQWDTTANAGFTTGTPYQSVNNDYATVNVKSLMQKYIKVYNVLGEVRSTNKAFMGNDIKVLSMGNGIAAFVRYHDEHRCVIVVNPSAATVKNVNINAALSNVEKGTVLVDTNEMKIQDQSIDLKDFEVLAHQALVIQVE